MTDYDQYFDKEHPNYNPFGPPIPVGNTSPETPIVFRTKIMSVNKSGPVAELLNNMATEGYYPYSMTPIFPSSATFLFIFWNERPQRMFIPPF